MNIGMFLGASVIGALGTRRRLPGRARSTGTVMRQEKPAVRPDQDGSLIVSDRPPPPKTATEQKALDAGITEISRKRDFVWGEIRRRRDQGAEQSEIDKLVRKRDEFTAELSRLRAELGYVPQNYDARYQPIFLYRKFNLPEVNKFKRGTNERLKWEIATREEADVPFQFFYSAEETHFDLRYPGRTSAQPAYLVRSFKGGERKPMYAILSNAIHYNGLHYIPLTQIQKTGGHHVEARKYTLKLRNPAYLEDLIGPREKGSDFEETIKKGLKDYCEANNADMKFRGGRRTAGDFYLKFLTRDDFRYFSIAEDNLLRSAAPGSFKWERQ